METGEAAISLGAAIGVGAVGGLLSGLTGIGGGVFLRLPLISPQHTAPKAGLTMPEYAKSFQGVLSRESVPSENSPTE